MKIGLQDEVVFLPGVILKRLADVGARDVDENVDTVESRERRVDRLRIGHVHAKRACGLSLASQRASMLLQLVHGARGQHSVRSGVGETLCDSQPDASAGAGDQGSLAGKRENVVHRLSVAAPAAQEKWAIMVP